jgi:proteic killer suppression protein
MSEKDIFEVILSENVKKELKRIPHHIQVKLLGWVDDVSNRGIREVRKTPGYHDEPLKGKRKGQRSIRLSKAYRGIYIVDNTNHIAIIKVIEVNKHEY